MQLIAQARIDGAHPPPPGARTAPRFYSIAPGESFDTEACGLSDDETDKLLDRGFARRPNDPPGHPVPHGVLFTRQAQADASHLAEFEDVADA